MMAKQTGERIVLMSEDAQNAHVLVSLDEYEELRGKAKKPGKPQVEHKMSPVEITEIPVKVHKAGTENAKIPPKYEEEERFYLEPLE